MSVLFGFAMCVGPALARGQEAEQAKDRPAAEAEIDASGFFHLGEFYEAHIWPYYYQVTGSRIAERFAAFEADAKRLGAPAEIEKDLADCTKQVAQMTFLTKPYGTWSPDELARWQSVPFLHEDLWKKWLNQSEYQPRFFWHLGRMSFKGWFIIGRDVLERGSGMKGYEKHLREVARVAVVLQTDTGYSTARARLTPEAAAALKTIADLSGPLDDPFTGVTLDHFKSIDAACETLRTLSQNQKLVAPASK